jgi:Cu2+-containing amine oxidase
MSSAYPLDPASAEEYLAGRDIMVAAGLLAGGDSAPVRFAYYGLEEAPKDEVLAGEAPDRRLRAYLVNTGSGESSDVVVSLTHQKWSAHAPWTRPIHGQMPILDSDFARVDEITKADPDWRAAMARRGYHDLSKIRTAPITAGAYGRPRTTGGGWSGCWRSSRSTSTTWPGRTRSTAWPPTWT